MTNKKVKQFDLYSDIDTSLSTTVPANMITNEDIVSKSLDNDLDLNEPYVPLLTTVELSNVETTTFEQEKTSLLMNVNESERNIDVQIKDEKPEVSLPDETKVVEQLIDVTDEMISKESSMIIEPQRPKFIQRLKPTLTVQQGEKLQLEVHFLAHPEPTVFESFVLIIRTACLG